MRPRGGSIGGRGRDQQSPIPGVIPGVVSLMGFRKESQPLTDADLANLEAEMMKLIQGSEELNTRAEGNDQHIDELQTKPGRNHVAVFASGSPRSRW